MKSTSYTYLLVLVLLSVCLVPALNAGTAKPFPAEGVFDFYIFGEPAGSTHFKSSVENGMLTITSHLSMNFEQFSQEMDSKTVVDAKTLRPISFSYEGVKNKMNTIRGSVRTYGDTLKGAMTIDDQTYPGTVLTDLASTVFFESYVAEHEILLARTFLASGEDYKNIVFFYPSDFMLTPTLMSLESEIELETAKGPVLCSKIMVSLQGGAPFVSYVDKATDLPIYMQFPSVNTEIFYHDYYGSEARPRFSRPAQQ